MEYSELVEALQGEDVIRVNKILEDLIPRLIRFLEIHMGAPRIDAEDCVQYSMELTLEVIRAGKLNDSEKVLTYLMTTCRNNYLKSREKKKEIIYDEIPKNRFHEPSQITSLVEQERKSILERCIEELKGVYRSFIEYWLEYPDSDADAVAEHFNISVNNVWTRKHRVIKQLNECYEKKSNL